MLLCADPCNNVIVPAIALSVCLLVAALLCNALQHRRVTLKARALSGMMFPNFRGSTLPWQVGIAHVNFAQYRFHSFPNCRLQVLPGGCVKTGGCQGLCVDYFNIFMDLFMDYGFVTLLTLNGFALTWWASSSLPSLPPVTDLFGL